LGRVRLSIAGSVRRTCRKISVVAGLHEQADTSGMQNHVLAGPCLDAQVPRRANDLVGPRRDLPGEGWALRFGTPPDDGIYREPAERPRLRNRGWRMIRRGIVRERWRTAWSRSSVASAKKARPWKAVPSGYTATGMPLTEAAGWTCPGNGRVRASPDVCQGAGLHMDLDAAAPSDICFLLLLSARGKAKRASHFGLFGSADRATLRNTLCSTGFPKCCFQMGNHLRNASEIRNTLR
jgi:hypothetical protein